MMKVHLYTRLTEPTNGCGSTRISIGFVTTSSFKGSHMVMDKCDFGSSHKFNVYTARQGPVL